MRCAAAFSAGGRWTRWRRLASIRPMLNPRRRHARSGCSPAGGSPRRALPQPARAVSRRRLDSLLLAPRRPRRRGDRARRDRGAMRSRRYDPAARRRRDRCADAAVPRHRQARVARPGAARLRRAGAIPAWACASAWARRPASTDWSARDRAASVRSRLCRARPRRRMAAPICAWRSTARGSPRRAARRRCSPRSASESPRARRAACRWRTGARDRCGRQCSLWLARAGTARPGCSGWAIRPGSSRRWPARAWGSRSPAASARRMPICAAARRRSVAYQRTPGARSCPADRDRRRSFGRAAEAPRLARVADPWRLGRADADPYRRPFDPDRAFAD